MALVTTIPHPYVRTISGTRVVVEPVAHRDYSVWVAGHQPYSLRPLGSLWFLRGYDATGEEHILGIKETRHDALKLAVDNYWKTGGMR